MLVIMGDEAYTGALEQGLAKLRAWAEGRDLSKIKSAWDLPKDCPLWKEGLSFAQAASCLATVKKEKK